MSMRNLTGWWKCVWSRARRRRRRQIHFIPLHTLHIFILLRFLFIARPESVNERDGEWERRMRRKHLLKAYQMTEPNCVRISAPTPSAANALFCLSSSAFPKNCNTNSEQRKHTLWLKREDKSTLNSHTPDVYSNHIARQNAILMVCRWNFKQNRRPTNCIIVFGWWEQIVQRAYRCDWDTYYVTCRSIALKHWTF